MDKTIQKRIIDFFSFFEKFYNFTKEHLAEYRKISISLNERIRLIKSIRQVDLSKTPLAQFDNLQAKLFKPLNTLICEEIKETQSKISTFEEQLNILSNKRKILFESTEEFDFTENSPLVKGTALQLPLKQLLTFTDDAFTFGEHIQSQIGLSLNVFNLRAVDSEHIIENFKILPYWQNRCEEIIIYTSFCSKNQI